MFREQVKIADEQKSLGSHDNGGLMEKLMILKAIRSTNDQQSSSSSRQRQNPRESSRPVADMDGPADSPAPSPVVDRTARRNGLGSSVGRGSIPPRDSTAQPEDGEPGEAPAKIGKITYVQGAEVAFKPKIQGEESDWILGTVVKVIGEGKSRRYDVQDPEPDERTKQLPVFRTSASSMIPIPAIGAPLPDYQKGKNVLARYPDTTTFYKAEVVGMNGKEVSLKFEGEEDAQAVSNVDRRFVLDYRVV
jgi:SAGA-associated factor 29